MSRVLDFMRYDKLTFRDLSLNGDASFNNNVFVSNDLVTNNRLFILGDVSLNNDIYVKETFITDGDASLNADLRVSNDTTLQQRLFVSEDVSLNSDLFIKEMLLVDGDASLNTNLKVSNDATLNDRLFVSGDASFNNNVFVSNDLLTNNDIRCNNRLFVLGDVSWNPNNLPNDCIPSTAIIGGVGSGGGGGSIVTGMILCWSGSADAVPSGWALCDGNNGTPDLTGKFVLGYGSSHSKAGTIGNNDEPKIVETTHLPPIAHADGDSNAPSVDHAATEGITSYTLVYSSNYDGGQVSNVQNWIGLPADHGAASVDDQEPYYPPYYVLAYIMKIDDTSSSSGGGGGSTTTTTTTASVVPVVTFVPSSTYLYDSPNTGQTGQSSNLLTSPGSISNYYWDEANQNLLDFNSLNEYISTQLKNNPSTHTVTIRHYNGTTPYDAYFVKGTNWTVDFIENSAALVSPIVTLYGNSTTEWVLTNRSTLTYQTNQTRTFSILSESTHYTWDEAMTIYVTFNILSAYVAEAVSNASSVINVPITFYDSNFIFTTTLVKGTHWTVDYQAFSESSTGSYWTQSTNDLYYTTGNVGIGTTTPSMKLDVSGSTNISEDLYVNDNVGIGTTDPSNLLHLYSSGDSSQMRLSNGTSTAGFILEQNTNKHTYISNTESTGDIIFKAGNAVRMQLMSDNIVTIGQGGKIRVLTDGKTSFHPSGNVDPKFQLDVFGLRLAYHHTFGNAGVQVSGRSYESNSINTDYINEFYTGYTTARFQEAVIARNFLAYSDSRIKTNIQEVNDSSALDKLRLLKPSLYNYIDVLARGNNQVYGFIAQEVKEVLPDAVSQYPEFVPNIYSFGTYDASTNIITIENENYDTASLSMDASNNVYKNIKIHDTSDNVIEVCIEEIVGPKEIKIKQDSEVNITSSIFAYGQEVEDFHKLNKDAIFTVTTSALQEVDRQLQAEKAKVATLESQLADVLSRLAALENA